MALFSMTLIYIVLAVIVLAILFIVGLILLIRGFLKRYLAEYAGKKTPAVMMTVGGVFVSLPVVIFVMIAVWSISSSVKTIYDRSHYECVPDIWRNESVSQSSAEDEIIKALLLSADKGSKEAFARNFTPELQKGKDFEKAVDAFFSNYPVGLSECEKEGKTAVNPDPNQSVKTGTLHFGCTLDDNWYSVTVEFCYRNTDHPEKVGVTDFKVMNLEAAAVYYDESLHGTDYLKDAYLICDIKSSSEINARLIGDIPYLWTPGGTPKVTADELRSLLKEGGRLSDPILREKLGSPNIGIKQDDSTEYGYFYEIVSENGEPRYVYIQTDSELGNILWALICTPHEVDDKHPLYEKK